MSNEAQSWSSNWSQVVAPSSDDVTQSTQLSRRACVKALLTAQDCSAVNSAVQEFEVVGGLFGTGPGVGGGVGAGVGA